VFDHLVLDQGSTDGTAEWLDDEFGAGRLRSAQFEPYNVGIAAGMNALLDVSKVCGAYDVIVKVDNDCELVTPGTLLEVALLAWRWDAVLSPHIAGLRRPPAAITKISDETATVSHMQAIGGIFAAFPAHFFNGWRCPTDVPVYDGDDDLMSRARSLGMIVGYVDGYHANHYRTTDGQHEDYAWYFERRVAEGGPA
jgi:GT2 family glycosyltransferase